jgi:hypothetical protein
MRKNLTLHTQNKFFQRSIFFLLLFGHESFCGWILTIHEGETGGLGKWEKKRFGVAAI